MIARIAGILCEIRTDEDGFGFIDVFIVDGQKLLPEWIVRGALDLASATTIARAVIKERLAGRIVIHDVEGRIYSLADPTKRGEEWKRESGNL